MTMIKARQQAIKKALLKLKSVSTRQRSTLSPEEREYTIKQFNIGESYGNISEMINKMRGENNPEPCTRNVIAKTIANARKRGEITRVANEKFITKTRSPDKIPGERGYYTSGQFTDKTYKRITSNKRPPMEYKPLQIKPGTPTPEIMKMLDRKYGPRKLK